MPNVKKPNRKPAHDPVLAMWTKFESPSEWRRSKKGNLWRRWEGMLLTIIKRNEDCFGWCVAEDDETQFSSDTFDTESDAMSDLGDAVGVGE